MGRIIMYMTSEQLKEYEASMMLGAPKDLPKLAAPKEVISNAFKVSLPTDHNELFDKWFKANPEVVNHRLVYNSDRIYSALKKP